VVLAKTEIQRKQTMNTPSIDQVKEFWDSRPCNIRHSDKVIGTKEYFDDVEYKRHFVEPHIIPFADFPNWKNKSVLEIGCGIATDGINFARQGADYCGVDLSEESIRIAKQRFEVYGLKGTLINLDAENMVEKLTNYKPFDLIYSFGVIHHTPDPRKAVLEIAKLMGEDTEFRFMVYAKNSWKNYMIEVGLDQPEAQSGCPIAFTYTKEEIVHDLLGKEFEVVNIKQDHIFPYQVEPYKKGLYIKQPWFEAMPDNLFSALKEKLGWHLLVTAKLS
jgi:2-polyprenyl-3-methyl-5-hydroxy-6-metoxy-1,4-benzoquinol methylase